MAEAFARQYGADAISAGVMPSEKINPIVVEAMKERGINLADYKPKMLTDKMIEDADYVVTMGCRTEDVCPKPLVVKMEKKLIDWHIKDPKGKSIKEVREIRSEIESNVVDLFNKMKT